MYNRTCFSIRDLVPPPFQIYICIYFFSSTIQTMDYLPDHQVNIDQALFRVQVDHSSAQDAFGILASRI